MRHCAINQFFRHNAVCLAVALCFADPIAYATPTGAQVVNGQVGFNQQGGVLSITNSPGAIINWQNFSIGANEAVRFIQQSSASSVLNRVTGQDPSQILGTLQSNGRVFLINPNGILFGQNARIDVAGLVASTLNLSNPDFLSNRLNFTPTSQAKNIDNWGRLNAASGGQIYLIAPDINNSGVISSPQGEILLAAGKSVQLVDTGTPGLRVEITAPGNEAVNLGQIISPSGRISMLGTLVSQKGIVSASSAVAEGGKIFLRATKHLGIAGDSQTTADGIKGGEIIAKVEDGGRIGGTLTGRGTLSAQGDGSTGSGGFVETSAANTDIDGLSVRTRGGIWLIDPYDFTIAAGGDITGTSLSTNLGSGNVVIVSSQGSNASGNGDININEPVSWSANTLTLTAARDININAVMTASGTSALTMNTATANGSDAAVAGGTVRVGFNPDGSFKGRVDFPGRSGTGFLTINGLSYAVINSLGAENSTTGTDLQGMRGSPSGHYALGGDIDASATSTWNWNGSVYEGFTPVEGAYGTTFTGSLNGLGHRVTGLTINRPSTDYVGLFSHVDASGMVHNLGVEGGSVRGRDFVGALAGTNDGFLGNSYAAVTVTGGANSFGVGGLVGENYASIRDSYARGNVSGGNGSFGVGGLVGINYASVSSSYATGNVTGGSGSERVGGLVGDNSGFGSINNSISNSYAAGTVSGGSNVGGLVGYSEGNIVGSHASGNVTGDSVVGGLTGYSEGSIADSFAAGNVAGSSFVGGLAGSNWGSVTNSHYDVDTVLINGSHYLTVGGLYGAQYQDWFIHDKTLNIAGYLGAPDADGYYTVGTVQNMKDLLAFADSSAYKFRLTADIDLVSATGLYIPILGAAEFDGAGHTISNLNLHQQTNALGLFGSVSPGSTLTNLGITGSVTGMEAVGGLAGMNKGSISNSHAAVTVTDYSGGSFVGGLVGTNSGSITRSFANGNVTVGDNAYAIGGLIGSNTGTVASNYATGSVTSGSGVSSLGGLVGWSNGSVTNSYAVGSVASGGTSSDIGGLLGHNNAGTVADSYGTGPVTAGTGSTYLGGLIGYSVMGAVTGSYWNTQTSGQGASAGGTGLTTAQMQDRTNFAGWDFVDTWRQYDGHTYPLLKDLLKPLTVTANNTVQTYDSTAYSGGNGVTLSEPAAAGSLLGTLTFSGTSQGARNAGSYTISPSGYWSDQQGYDITFASGTLTINQASLPVTGVIATDKVYDGNTAALLNGGSIQPFAGDSVTLSAGIGEFADRHVGTEKTVTASGYIISGPDAGNYTLVQPSGLAANISRRPSVAWIGGPTGDWSNPANWQDGALPDRSNVLAVSIPSGTTVVYGAAADNTNLANLASGGEFLLTGGNLHIADSFQTARFGQSGGSLTGTGNFTVNEAFHQTAGSIDLVDTAAANITQVSGDLIARSIKAGAVSLRTQDGAILDGGMGTSITAASLTLAATRGIGNAAAPLRTAVGWLTANNNEGDIVIVNNGALTVAGITNAGSGDINIDNTGALVTTGPVTATSGNISIVTHSPLTIGADGLSASGDIQLTASPSGDSANDNLSINGPIRSGGQAILGAGNEIIINAEVNGATGVKVDQGNVSARSTVLLSSQDIPGQLAETTVTPVVASTLSVFKPNHVQDTAVVQSQAALLTIEPDVPGSQPWTSEHRSNKRRDVANGQDETNYGN